MPLPRAVAKQLFNFNPKDPLILEPEKPKALEP